MLPNMSVLDEEYKLNVERVEMDLSGGYNVKYFLETGWGEAGFEQLIKDLEKIKAINRLSSEIQEKLKDDLMANEVMEKLTK